MCTSKTIDEIDNSVDLSEYDATERSCTGHTRPVWIWCNQENGGTWLRRIQFHFVASSVAKTVCRMRISQRTGITDGRVHLLIFLTTACKFHRGRASQRKEFTCWLAACAPSGREDGRGRPPLAACSELGNIGGAGAGGVVGDARSSRRREHGAPAGIEWGGGRVMGEVASRGEEASFLGRKHPKGGDGVAWEMGVEVSTLAG
jgi:hypothetical protein